MKEIVVKVDDDAYRRAEGIANSREISVSTLLEELVELVTNDAQTNSDKIKNLLSALVEVELKTNEAHPNSDDINYLFSALDNGRNTESIGPLRRQELHDRPALHRY